MMATTKMWDALSKALEGKEIVFPKKQEKQEKQQAQSKSIKQKTNKTDKQKYLNKIEWMPENERTMEYLKSIITPKLNDALYDLNVQLLKDIMKIKMRNGIYKAVVKERKENWVIISLGRAKIEWDEKWKMEDVTLDYMIWNTKIDKSYVKWDELFVDLNLNKEKKRLKVKEFKLSWWDICSVKITNISKKWAFVCVGKYEWFITNEQLKKSEIADKKIKKWDEIFMKIKIIRDNNKNKNKKWIIWDVAKKPSKDVIVTNLDPVINDKNNILLAA